MSPLTFQRAIWLAGITLVVAVGALALARRDAGGGRESIPAAVPVPGTANGYYTGRAGPYRAPAGRTRTACGEAFTTKLEGIAHPVLPCGVKIYVRFAGKEVLTQVVDRGPAVTGRDFGITKALADRLGLHGTQTIQWRYAR
jgi:rare lipoprotein A (peptidoglycan hydrolase)